MQLYDEIRSHFHIPDAYRYWKPYRDLLSDYLVHEPGKLSTLAILGAGACNDIDLYRIRSGFSEITLIDYDYKAMQEAVRRYGLEKDAHVLLQPASLTGIGDEQYEQFCDALQGYARKIKDSVSIQEFDAFAISVLQSFVYENAVSPLSDVQYDYVWCVGVHSQLNAMFSYIYRVFWENLYAMHLLNAIPKGDGPEDSAFMAYLRELNTSQIKGLHDDIFKAVRRKAFIGCEVGRTDAYYSGMYSAALEEAEMIEGAYQGIMDIRSRDLRVDESIVCWPFYPENQVYFDMLLQKIHINVK